jgi:hypothetical protein
VTLLEPALDAKSKAPRGGLHLALHGTIIENAIVAEYNDVVSIETAYFNELIASLE